MNWKKTRKNNKITKESIWNPGRRQICPLAIIITQLISSIGEHSVTCFGLATLPSSWSPSAWSHRSILLEVVQCSEVSRVLIAILHSLAVLPTLHRSFYLSDNYKTTIANVHTDSIQRIISNASTLHYTLFQQLPCILNRQAANLEHQ